MLVVAPRRTGPQNTAVTVDPEAERLAKRYQAIKQRSQAILERARKMVNFCLPNHLYVYIS